MILLIAFILMSALKESSGFKIINKLETFVLDQKDQLRLNLHEYFEFDSEATTKVKGTFYHADMINESEKDSDILKESEDFQHEIIRGPGYVQEFGKLSFILTMREFQRVRTTDRKNQLNTYCLRLFIETREATETTPCMKISIKVVDVNNLPEAVHSSLDNTNYMYNPETKTNFLHSYKNCLSSSLNYEFKCTNSHSKDSSSDSDSAISMISTNTPSFDKNLKLDVISKTESKIFILNNLMIEVSNKLNFIRLFYLKSDNMVELIRGLQIQPECAINPVFLPIENQNTSFYMLCYGTEKSASGHLEHIQIRTEGTVYRDSIALDNSYKNCTYGRNFGFLSCLYNPAHLTDDSNNKMIHYYKILNEPLQLQKVVNIDDNFIGGLLLASFYNHPEISIEDLIFTGMSPCPRIPTTIVIKTEGVFKNNSKDGSESLLTRIYTVHLNVNLSRYKEYNPLNVLQILSVHLIEEIQGRKLGLTKNMDICGYKNNMIVFRRQTETSLPTVYSDLNENSQLHFPSSMLNGKKILQTICLADEGYFVILYGPKARSESSLEMNSIIVYNGNNVVNAKMRVFAALNVDGRYNRIFTRVDKITSHFIVYIQKEGINDEMSIFRQSTSYPEIQIKTTYPGEFSCQIRINENPVLGQSDTRIRTQKVAEIQIKVNGFSRFEFISRKCIEFNDKMKKINIEDYIKFKGNFFNAKMLFDDKLRDTSKLSFKPRHQLIREFRHEIYGSDYLDILVIDRNLFFGIAEDRIDVILMPRKKEGGYLNSLDQVESYQTITCKSCDLKDKKYLASSEMNIKYRKVVAFAVLNVLKTKNSFGKFEVNLNVITFDRATLELLSSTRCISMDFDDIEEIQDVQIIYNSNMDQEIINPREIESGTIVITYLSTDKRKLMILRSMITLLNGSIFLLSNPAQEFKILDIYSMRNLYFQVSKYSLRRMEDTRAINANSIAYAQDFFYIDLISNMEFIRLTFNINMTNRIHRYESRSMMKYSDVVYSFGRSNENNFNNRPFSIFSLNGGSFTLVYDDATSNFKYTDREKSNFSYHNHVWPVPTTYPVKKILIGREYMVAFNMDFEDNILVYKLSKIEEVYFAIKKTYGVNHVIKLLYNYETEEDELLISNGKDVGQVFRITPLLLMLNRDETISIDTIMSPRFKVNILDHKCYSSETEFKLMCKPQIMQKNYDSMITTLLILLSLLLILLCVVYVVYQKNLKKDYEDRIYKKASCIE